jgi:hypothetical protein
MIMSDIVCVTMHIGGMLLPAEIPAFIDLVAREGLVGDDGAPFTAEHISGRAAVELHANQVPWRPLDHLETYCIAHRLPFRRWCSASPGRWEADRLVYDGRGEPRSYNVTDDDVVLLTEPEIRSLGSIAAIRAYLCSAQPCLPPLGVLGRCDR